MTAALDRARRALDAPPPPAVPGQLAVPVPHGPRIGSLCSGYGGLDMAVAAELGASVAWHCQYDPDDRHQYAARILTHHWPDVPNHGDITTVDWSSVEPVDILTAGFPCQDVSLAGLRAGIAEGTRSGLWAHVARAISVLRPRLVVIENVRGLLSARADRGMGPDGTPLDQGDGPGALRAVGAVLGDLAALRFDAEWQVQRASEIGAPHQRERVFILAWPTADTDDERGVRTGSPGREPQRHAAGPDRDLADAQGEGQQGEGVRGRATGRRTASQNADLKPGRERREPAPGEAEAGRARPDTRRRGRAPATDTGDGGLPGHPESPPRRNAVRPGVRGNPDGRRRTVPHAEGGRRHQGESEPTTGQPAESGEHGEQDRGHTPVADTPGVTSRGGRGRRRRVAVPPGEDPQERETGGHEPAPGAGRPTPPGADPVCDWGIYAPAVARWEAVTGTPAPRPTDDHGRLSPGFVEWMMGLPAGHVTAVPGLPRSAQLRALGNGVVPPQAAAAVRFLLRRAGLAERWGLPV